MSESDSLPRNVIPEFLILGRLAQSEQMRGFFIQMWIQNPMLAKQGGLKVQTLLSPLVDVSALLPDSTSGFTVDIAEDVK